MFKKSIVKVVSIDSVKYDRIFLRVWKHAKNPKFFTAAVDRFKHYANPVAYELQGVYYIINKFGSLEALIDLGQDEISLDIINLNQNDVLEFLLSFQYHEHKETRCMAELIKVTTEYIATPEGKRWLKTITKSEDKEEQFSELFGISIHAAKCYLKLIQPGNEKYLDMLAADKNYRPSKAYSDCVAEEKKPKPNVRGTSDEGPGKQAGSTKCSKPGKSTPDGSNPDTTTDSGQSEVPTNIKPPVLVPSEQRTPAVDFSKMDDFVDYLKQYEKGNSTPDEELPAQPLARKVVVTPCDGKHIELVGDIQLKVDGKIISNTGQLEELPNGDWGVPKGFNDVALTLVSEDNFWENF